jgi:hypothetical protein
VEIDIEDHVSLAWRGVIQNGPTASEWGEQCSAVTHLRLQIGENALVLGLETRAHRLLLRLERFGRKLLDLRAKRELLAVILGAARMARRWRWAMAVAVAVAVCRSNGQTHGRGGASGDGDERGMGPRRGRTRKSE